MSVERRLVTALVGGIGAVISGIMPCSLHAEGLTEQQIAFAARLVQQESGGNQRDRTGAVLVSSAGAKGLFQLMPATAASLHVNPDTTEGNIRGGLSLIVRLWNKYSGDRRLVAIAYNWGESHADAIASGQHVELPEETRRYVIAVVSGADAPPSAIQTEASQVHSAAPSPDMPPACAPAWDPWALASCSVRKPRTTIAAQPQQSNTETASR